MVVRITTLVLGALLAFLGVLLLVLPGPGILFLAMAGALFASESFAIARLLDWLEVDARALVRWARARFGRGSTPSS